MVAVVNIIFFENKDDVKEWWQDFRARFNAPLYAIILASTSDTEVASCVVNHRKEIAAVSGNDCCFIYFRDINNAKFLEKFQFSEHVERVYPFTRFIGIKYDTLPCIVFFEDIDSGEYICVSLAGLSQEQIISRMRDIFSHVYVDKKPQFLRRLRGFQHSQVIRESKEKLLRNISEIGKETVIELIKSLLPLLR